MKEYGFMPVAILMNFTSYEESEEDDCVTYECHRTFFVSLQPDEMLDDINYIVSSLGFDSKDRLNLLKMIERFQNGEIQGEDDFASGNNHWYCVGMDYAYSLKTCEKKTISLAETLVS